ncbi:MAG TPA: 2-C-methyl-D-erythritol 4-phosphate cytidylyltransferase, partial [Alphaproteobacteria bacterium]|nr:2-C-methyl-D-erythritol 4-phosphate cytidylyltransferase [Alphaproteobacteria bacterium]
MTTAALIVAAGRGTRAGFALPKQYQALGGQPVLRHTIAAFAAHPGVDLIQVVIHPDDATIFGESTTGLDIAAPVPGGDTRQKSVFNGLEALARRPAVDRVLIHDAARPFVTTALIGRVIDALQDAPGAIPVMPISDTVKRVERDQIGATVDRSNLVRAQTPQGFRLADILAAHRAAEGLALTDDAAIAEQAGLKVITVPGDERNFKITDAADLSRAEALLSGDRPDIRTGNGFDVHRFTAGDHVMLCGVKVPHDQGLEGFSDADVGLHAITDAILGALGAGDIGMHFPPGDPRWAGADSSAFLAHAGQMVLDRGGVIGHLDLTL